MLHSDKRGIRGLTLVEMMIVIAILAIFLTFVFQNIMNARRIAAIEEVRLNMDQVADGVLRTLSSQVKNAVLPVRPRPLTSNAPIAKLLRNHIQGFGFHAREWESRLVNGTNFLAFCTPVDADGSGDCLDGNFLPYLGIEHPNAFSFPIGGGKTKTKNEIIDAEYNSDFKLLNGSNYPTSISPGLATVFPDDIQQQGLPAAEDAMTLPVPWGAYAIVRFVPLMLADGVTPVIVHEGVDSSGSIRGLECDINGDGLFESTRQFYIGNIEVFYPGVTWSDLESGTSGTFDPTRRVLGTMDMVAVPVEERRPAGNFAGWDVPLFSLVALDSSGGFVDNDPNSPSSDPDDFKFESLRIMLTLVNYHDRDNIRVGDPDHTGSGDIVQNKFHIPGGRNVTAKRYETVVHLRNL